MSSVNITAAALLGVAINTQVVAKLIEKGILELDDAHDIYSKALMNLASPTERNEATRILKTIMPGLEVNDRP